MSLIGKSAAAVMLATTMFNANAAAAGEDFYTLNTLTTSPVVPVTAQFKTLDACKKAAFGIASGNSERKLRMATCSSFSTGQVYVGSSAEVKDGEKATYKWTTAPEAP